MTDKQLAAIEPCPMCGGEPSRFDESLDERYGYALRIHLSCKSCGLKLIRTGDASKGGYADNSKVESNVIAAWNRRAVPAKHENCACSQWIRVEDALPKEDEVVFATGWAFNDPTKGRYYDRARFIGREFFNEDSGDDLHPPTHWMRPVDPEAAPAAPTEGARDAGVGTAVAWLVDMPGEPELGHWFAEEKDCIHRSTPLYAHPDPLLAECVEALEKFRKAFVIAVGDRSPFAKFALADVDNVLAKVQAAKEGKS